MNSLLTEQDGQVTSGRGEFLKRFGADIFDDVISSVIFTWCILGVFVLNEPFQDLLLALQIA
jgi:hypothetical protein